MRPLPTAVFAVVAVVALANAPLRAAEADLTAPLKAITTFATAMSAGDAATAKSACANLGDARARAFDAIAGAVAAYAKLQAAAEARLGAEAGQRVAQRAVTAEMKRAMKEMIDLAAKNLKVDGDTATLPRNDADKRPMVVKKSADGKWRMDADTMDLSEKDSQEIARRMQNLSKAMVSLADDVAAGKFAGAEDLLTAMSDRASEATKPPQSPSK